MPRPRANDRTTDPGVTRPHRTEGGAGGGSQLPESIRTDVAAFERAVIQLREVVYSHHVTGNYDYLLQVEVADLPAYEDFHANRLANLPAIAAVSSYVTMKSLSVDAATQASVIRFEMRDSYDETEPGFAEWKATGNTGAYD